MKPDLPVSEDRRHPIRRVSFYTLGCKLNQAETASIAALFARRGYEVVPFHQPADLTYINTCTVTNEADAKSRQIIRQAVRASPGGRVVAVGCYAQVKPEEVAALDGVDMVLGTHEKYQIFDLLDRLEGGQRDRPLVRVTDTGDLETYDESPFISATSRTRAFLKVQEGCDYACSYCIIPMARGRARSRPLASCLSEVRRLVAEGFREVVLTGVNIGTWGDGAHRFHHLLAQVSDVAGLRRVRVSSIEPNLVTDELLKVVAGSEKICPHFHVPLQHASDRILRAMRRRYTMADYRRIMDRITAALPDAAIGADVIVGFPGETDADFQQLADALTRLPTTYHHIFRFSERTGTVAAKLTDPVDPVLRKERSAVLREISRKKEQTYAQRFIGQIKEVYFERSVKEDRWEGLTDNYLRVRVPVNGQRLEQTFQPVRLTGWEDSVLSGTVAGA
ncbi:MAG: tRNA (N(6)-L-threonylcarbamoyladenosine(37)-C(2))-methylthiotransferase MtaB [Candidatus Marinimicrobia bacterium]|nr:tRNA (N(6)-L-threonylcarbamoyladenosine(37)-C(2))-methylthiotransferase MtaB [Candidatus Neomarinimicrobiota bacterium]